jgi:hypothetical protein
MKCYRKQIEYAGGKDMYQRLRRGGVEVIAGDGGTAAADPRTTAPLAPGTKASTMSMDRTHGSSSTSMELLGRRWNSSRCIAAGRRFEPGARSSCRRRASEEVRGRHCVHLLARADVGRVGRHVRPRVAGVEMNRAERVYGIERGGRIAARRSA